MTRVFWKRYIQAGELERYRILEELSILEDEDGFYKYFNTTLFRSYLDDLIEYMEDREK